MRKSRVVKKGLAAVLAALMVFAALPQGLAGMLKVNAADAEITTTTHTYSFKSNDGKTAPVLEAILDGTDSETSGILYMGAGTNSNGITFETKQLRFRNGSILYLPINDDTTKVKYEQVCSNSNSGRPTYVGSADSGYSVEMSNKATSVTINDITDYIVTVNGQKYLPIVSGGDVKIYTITLTEYNPVNTVLVTGTVVNAAEHRTTEIYFQNMTNQSAQVVSATLDDQGNYSVALRRVNGDTTYKAYIAQTGYKLDNNDDADLLRLTGNGTTATADFTVVTNMPATISGSITGIPADAVVSELTVQLIPQNNDVLSVELPLNREADGTYTFENVEITTNSNYNVVISGADDYAIQDIICVPIGTHTGLELPATLKETQTVSGEFVTSDGAQSDVSSITFTNMSDSRYAYTFDVTGGVYAAQLREGEYVTSVQSEKYTAFDHVSVHSSNVSNHVYLEAPEDTSAVAYEETVLVGEGQQFTTIREAAAYIQRMTRTADQRVTIQLTDSLYREQIVLDTPNVTITSDTSATVTWYYGVGYSYYSANPTTRYYDEAYAVDQYTTSSISMNPGHWGATMNLTANAAGFRSENIVYENSFNRYMTTEEVADGVGEGGENSKVNRSTATDRDIQLYTNKERACTMFIEADNCEFNQCSFLSSQDTLFTGNNTESTYFKNCVIEGTTDYICGDGNAVFDECTLSMYGYADKAASGSIIVASKAVADMGYLFNNCKVVKTSYEGINKGITKTYFARPWRANSKVTFLNTQVEDANTIAPVGYTSMSGVTPAQANYYEYNTHLADGTAVSTSSRASGVSIMSAQQAEAVSMEAYFGDWTPFYYQAETVPADYTEVDKAIEKANQLTPSKYVDFSGVTNAINAVVKDLTAEDQAKVDQMASAINAAINALVEKQPETEAPTQEQTQAPSEAQTEAPTQAPTEEPTQAPTEVPTEAPTETQGTTAEVAADVDTVTGGETQVQNAEVAADETVATADHAATWMYLIVLLFAASMVLGVTMNMARKEESK